MKTARSFFAIALLVVAVSCSPGKPAAAAEDVPPSAKSVPSVTPATAGNATAAVKPVADGNFSHSCWNIGLAGSGNDLVLEAVCGNGGGGNNGVVGIYIDNCISNKNGALTCKRNGNALHSCYDCYLADGFELVCTCNRSNGGSDLTGIYLDNCITNRDGNLTC